MERLILTGRFDFVDFFLKLFLGTKEPVLAVVVVMTLAGMWRMFEKSGLKGW